MLVALIANLTLLPLLIVWLKPMGAGALTDPDEGSRTPA